MNIGLIGCGNMARAMIEGMLRSGAAKPSEIMASALRQERLADFADRKKIHRTADNTEVAKFADIVILAVKPNKYAEVIAEISPHIWSTNIVISLAPGITLAQLEALFGKPVKLIRTMPNTPATVLEGMTAMCSNVLVEGDEKRLVKALFEGFGKVEEIEEAQMDAVIAVSGSSPAYAFMMMEAMADAAVLRGLPRSKAYTFAAQAMLGAAKMVLETGEHPAVLKDQVCSPGGTTIEAVRVLEEKGFRSAIIEAMHACADKSKRM